MGWLHKAGTRVRPVILPATGWQGGAPIGGLKSAWCGGCIDTSRGGLITFGGGHNDSPINGVYREHASGAVPVCLIQPTPNAQVTPPAQAPPHPDPYVADGRPASRHTYAGVSYIDHLDALWATGGSRWSDGGPTARNWLFFFSGALAGQWQMRTNFSAGVVNAANAYDPLTQFGYVMSNGGQLRRYNFATDAYTNIGAAASSLDLANFDPVLNCVFDAERKWWITVGPRNGRRPTAQIIPPFEGNPINVIRFFDLNNLAAGNQTKTLTGNTTWLEIEGVAFAKNPTNGKWYAWSGINHVWEVDLDANTSTLLPLETWPGQPMPTGVDVAQGRYHGWGWAPTVGGFICSPTVDTDVMIYTLGATVLIDTAGGITTEIL